MKDKAKDNIIPGVRYKFSDGRNLKEIPDSSEIIASGKPYVNWGKKNEYPLFLNQLYEESPSQTGIINGKVYWMTAGGYTIQPLIDSPDIQVLINLFKENKNTDYSLQDLLVSVIKDYELYNGYAVRGKWNIQGTSPAYLEHIDFDTIRTNSNYDEFYISNDWSNGTQSYEKTGYRRIPVVDLNNRVGEFIIYSIGDSKKTKKGANNVYPTAPYSGCIKSLLSQIGMQSYHYYEIINGFKTGTIINLPSSRPKSEEDRALIAEDIKSGAVEESEAGGVVVLFSEGATEPPTIMHLTGNDLDKRYLQTEVSVANTILMCHSITTPSLFGMAVPGQLGNSTELENGYQIFKSTYVASRQKSVNDFFTWIMNELYNIKGTFTLNAPPPLFGEIESDSEGKISKAINSMSPLLATKLLEVLTVNEIRSLGLLPAVTGGDTIRSMTPAAPTFEEEADFSAKDPILKAFENCGRSRSRFIFAKTATVPHDAEKTWFEDSEKDLIEEFISEKHFFATILSDFQKNVLTLINDGEDVKSVATALKRSIQQVMDAYVELSGKGLIKKNGELSETGKRYLVSVEIPADKFEVRYSYELRPGVPELSKKGIGESRPFCKKLMDLDRLYTRDEIDKISMAVDRNIWSYRGGWYHNPNSDQNTPYCRHLWKQNVVIKK